MSQGNPPKCTGEIEFILIFLYKFFISFIERFAVKGSTSQKIVFPPVNIDELAVDTNDIGDVSKFFL